MGWLQRLFGQDTPEDAQVNPEPAATSDESGSEGESIPPERLGLNGEYDQSGLAKRVALAFDEDGRFDEIYSIYVAQLGGTVVLKGEVPSQDILDQLVEVAQGVTGATDVQSDQVSVVEIE
ncbi:BON domain-containing protein [Aetokthonos hydrillicola Thurmond2011]|jgi:osmotically-inducible protein OsmY|uniref:BON domain-containing protein n=1 Tax=Aetokthonos hydrillicola Thurmond2011 TaxID=2712845 RepID=A0AAP5I283_9CYAN|nr:BON domain-containing protein [Aetokthonos hydrillicola]MBO3457489.1 BON domain-containing protein [Aetokthonos hydrillicola CCALA 1050]MBW4585989.1 BON domain-containing protein [Aetokthonos hydrillicola CCALA 1050]MDR9893782.1 BON domain-containing protein [Aetokthonos hydrillicola Thurmond2011]